MMFVNDLVKQRTRVPQVCTDDDMEHSAPLNASLYMYCQTSDVSHTLVGNTIVDHSDVVGASPVGTAPTTSSFST